MRFEVVYRVESIIKTQFPQARVEVFGSFQTGLFLPTSDIDMVVFNQVDAVRTGALYQLQDTLIQQNIAEKMSIKVRVSTLLLRVEILELVVLLHLLHLVAYSIYQTGGLAEVCSVVSKSWLLY